MRFLTAHDTWYGTPAELVEELQELATRSAWVSRDFAVPAPVLGLAAPVVRAYVNWARWIVRCGVCGSHQMVHDADPFMCAVCFNIEWGHAWARVDFPAERSEIEAILALRRNPQLANWNLGESLDELRAENVAHGHELP